MNENHIDLSTTDTQGRASQGSNCGDCVHVFISHKNEDAQAAYKLRDMLKRHSNRLRFFLSEEIPAGADWRGWISDHLGRANLLFFLCTNPASNWDWCLYETGIFEGIRKGKVIVLHSHEGQAPTPLTHLQSIPATRDRVAEFLRVFFGTSDITEIEPPLNESLASKNNLLMDIADEIVALFAQAVSARPHYFHRHLVVRIPETDPCRGNTMPAQSRVDADRPTLELLGIGEKPARGKWSWGEMREHGGVNRELMSYLEESICRASRGELFPQPRRAFQHPAGNRIFQPVLYRLDVDEDSGKIFSSVFVEQQVSPTASYAPPDHATLLSSVTLASRFHWELFDRFSRDLREWKNEEEIKAGCQRLKEAMESIQLESDARREAEVHQPTQGDRLRWAFEWPADREYVDDNLARQNELKARLVAATNERDTESIRSALAELRDCNGELVLRVCARYKELLERDVLMRPNPAPGRGGGNQADTAA